MKSRKGEIRKNPRTKSTKKKDPKKRQLECVKRKEKRVDENVELSKQGLYKCGQCNLVKPESLFPQHVPTVWKFKVFTVRDL